MRALQAEYRARPEHRAAAAERVRAFFAQPGEREEWRERSSAQWQDEKLLAWRSRTTVEHSAPTRLRMADASTGHLEKIQAGRRRYVESVPREEKVARHNEGRRIAALKRLAPMLDTPSNFELALSYELDRTANAKTGLNFPKVLAHYDNDFARLREAASMVNHAVASVEALPEREDVYDLTVDGYHNFALEAGVFVHNSARMARVSEYQALLPLRGKILNVQKASLADTLRNAEIASIVQVLGAGTGRTFDISQMRYGRVILMADADVDGSHIRTLLITLFAKYMRPVIEDGRLYAAMPPLHKVMTRGRNAETHFTFTQREMEQKVAQLEKAGKQVVTPVPRFKGLGEMDADELWETTMNPATRSVRRITMDDVEAAETALELLMGEKVEPRRNWLVESAARVDQSAIDL
jgi:DNA gyrase subunit B